MNPLQRFFRAWLRFMGVKGVELFHDSGLSAEVSDQPQVFEKSPRGPEAARILIHAINYAPEQIGCAKYTTELAEYLVAQGHSVEAVAAPPHYPGWYVRDGFRAFGYSRDVVNGVSVTRCPLLMKRDGGGVWRLLAPLTFAFFAAPAVVWRVLRARPDVVMCVEPTLFSAPAALIAARLVGARAVLHVQDLEVDAAFEVGHIRGQAIRKAAAVAERVLLDGFDSVVTISEKMRAALIAKGLDAGKVALRRNWVDLEAITPLPRGEGNNFRKELGLEGDRFVALYAGHIGVKQALDVVLDAAARLQARTDMHFVIAGDGPMKARLQEKYAGLPNVSYLPLQPVERLNELLGLADLHLLPQHKGAADLVLPSKLGGMLASGRPIVATVESGTELSDLLAGVALLTPAGDAAALADSVAAARSADLSENVEQGLRLAQSLSSRRILPQFEETLVGASERGFAGEGDGGDLEIEIA